MSTNKKGSEWYARCSLREIRRCPEYSGLTVVLPGAWTRNQGRMNGSTRGNAKVM